MKKYKCKVSECADNLILAEDIFSAGGILLVLENTEMNDYIRNKLLSFGIDCVNIYEPLSDESDLDDKDSFDAFKKDYFTYVNTVRELIKELASGKNLDFEKVNFISDSIYRQIKSNHVIANCINQIKIIDGYTYTHSINVSLYAMLIGRWLKQNDSEIRDLIMCGILHDLGKVKIPDEILNKAGPLLDSEFEIMKKHPLYGYEFIKNAPQISSKIKEAVLTHHEKVNGKGYPFGISGDKISLYSKIIAVADTYDAITSSRVYRPKRTPFSAFSELEASGMGTGLYEPRIILCFFSNISRYYTGSNVRLNDGRTGKVAYVPPHSISTPVVKVGEEYIDLSVINNIHIAELI